MSQNVGEIGLGLTLDQKGFGLQTKSLERMAKRAGRKIGTALAAGLSVKALASFTKSCLDLGSDLQEVQNVVDTAFPGMSAQVDAFAKSAATSFGLSETMAKKYVGTFGAMSKSFGFTEREAYAMSTALTGLAGDVASFYNMSQDEAYTKLKSVFTGETESLKDLGVVMTQANLDQFALANGFGKTTAAMTEQEKVALRYKFVVDQLSLANGDFAKTSNSWANQVRILTLQFESFKAALGQGFINILTPVIQMINTLMTRLVALANSFKSFTELITGKKSRNNGLANTANDADALATSADNASDSVSNIGDTAKKTANKLKRSLFGFDQINKVDSKDSSASSSSGPTGASTAGIDTGLTGAMKEQTEQSKLLGAGYEALRASVARLKESFSNFVSVIVSGVKWAWENILKPLGKWTLQELAPRLINILAGAFDVLTAALKAVAPVFETVWNVFLKPIAKFAGKVFLRFLDVCANLLDKLAGAINKHPKLFASFVTALLGLLAVKKVTAKFSNGLTALAAYRKGIVSAGSVLSAFSPKLGNVANSAKLFGNTLKYTKSPLRAFSAIFPKLASRIAGAVKVLGPLMPKGPIVLGIMAAVAAGILIYKNWDKIKKAAKKVGQAITKAFKPIANFFKKTWKNAINKGADVIENMRDRIKGVVDGLKTYFGGWIDFITGVFTGNWEKAWDGIKGIFTGYWDTIKEALNLPDLNLEAKVSAVMENAKDWWTDVKANIAEKVEGVKAKIAGALENAKDWWTDVKANMAEKVEGLKVKIAGALETASDWWTSVKTSAAEKVAGIKAKISGELEKTVDWWTGVKSGISEKIGDVKKAVSAYISTSAETLKAGIDTLLSGIGTVKKAISAYISTTKDSLKAALTERLKEVGKISKAVSAYISTGSKALKTAIKTRLKKVGAMSKAISAYISTSAKSLKSALQKKLNAMGSFTKSVKLKLTATVSNLKGWINNNIIKPFNKKSPINIPLLAQGGYVKKNTPQLAVIGDNRHQGEVVAPEDKLLQMARQAAAMSGGGTSPEVLELLRAILRAIEALEFEVYLDGKSIKKRVVDLINANTTATGVCELIV